MEVIGVAKVIGKTENIGSNGFSKRDIVVTTDEKYPQHISVQFVQDKVDLLDKIAIGDNVKININLRGREWVSPQGETKYFNTIQGWRIEKVQGTPLASPTPAPNTPNTPPEDDLPF